MITFLIMISIGAIFVTEKAYAKRGHLVVDCFLHEKPVGHTNLISAVDVEDYSLTCFNAFADLHEDEDRIPLDPTDTHPSLPHCFQGKKRFIPGG